LSGAQSELELQENERDHLGMNRRHIGEIHRHPLTAEGKGRQHPEEGMAIAEPFARHEKKHDPRIGMPAAARQPLETAQPAATGVIRRIAVRVVETGSRQERNPVLGLRAELVLHAEPPVALVEIGAIRCCPQMKGLAVDEEKQTAVF
jgi:rubrerythrin